MAMAAHTAWNYLQNIVLGLPNSGRVMPYAIFKLDTASARNGFAYTTDFGIEGSVMAILVQVAAIAAFLYLIKKMARAPPTSGQRSAIKMKSV
jgi:hypothetical protein